jgi:hypothetical protein
VYYLNIVAPVIAASLFMAICRFCGTTINIHPGAAATDTARRSRVGTIVLTAPGDAQESFRPVPL